MDLNLIELLPGEKFPKTKEDHQEMLPYLDRMKEVVDKMKALQEEHGLEGEKQDQAWRDLVDELKARTAEARDAANALILQRRQEAKEQAEGGA